MLGVLQRTYRHSASTGRLGGRVRMIFPRRARSTASARRMALALSTDPAHAATAAVRKLEAIYKKLEQAFRRLPPNDTDSVDLQGEAINSKGMKNLLKKLKGSKKTIQKVLNRFGLNDYDGGKVVTMEEFLIELGIEW